MTDMTETNPADETNPPKPAKAKRIDVIVLRGIGGEDGNMIFPSNPPVPVSLPIAMAKRLQDAGAVKVHIED
ncbi:hypothetical protein [Thiothrix fructosivorans]|uniref:Uncharacterized protein n=2 Tax=Thiothrix fructosivorans TaxID=111770 RepID=A0ABS3IFD1_9GAMM|nr:hypothetical protein [Thiothrix fructosivorans]MBO0611711.1 hypothetical protein [Thiothrix fructosivorans]